MGGSYFSQADAEKRAKEYVADRFQFVSAGHPMVVWLADAVEKQLLKEQIAEQRLLEPIVKSCEGVPAVECSGISALSLESIDELADSLQLPSLPQAFYELQRLTHDESTSAQDLAKVISLDPKLTSSLLRLVNSGLFNFQSTIDTVSRAVAVLGTRQISTLALGTLMLGLFKERQPEAVNLEEFWRHSIGVGIVSRTLAELCGRDNSERYFVAGLLHDIGWLALCTGRGEDAAKVLEYSSQCNVPFTIAEQSVLGFSHGELGARLFENWHFPPNLVAAVRHHHEPSALIEFDEPVFVHIADTVVKSLGVGAAGDSCVSPLDESAWDALGLEPVELSVVVAMLEKDLQSMVETLVGK